MDTEPTGTGTKWETTTGHVIGPTFYYDVIDFVIVAKQRSRAAWQQTQNQWRLNGNNDVKYDAITPNTDTKHH